VSLLDGNLSASERWAQHYFTCQVCQEVSRCAEGEPLREASLRAAYDRVHQSFAFGERDESPDAEIFAARLRTERWVCSLCGAEVTETTPKCSWCGALLLIDREEAVSGGPRA